MPRTSELSAGPDKTSLFVIRSLDGRDDLAAWLPAHRALVEEQLLRHAGVLFANFAVDEAADFDRVVSTVGEKMGYQNRLSPRQVVGDNIFTATERDERFRVPFHNENSKDVRFPGRIWFYCRHPALRGGETTISDARAVLRRLSPRTVERFLAKRLCYVLSFESGKLDVTSEDVKSKVGFGWQFYFGTDDKKTVEGLCAEEQAEFEWLPNDGLRMTIARPAIVRHPKSHDRLWFNHVNVFSSTAKLLANQAGNQRSDGDDRYVLYGDRTPIEAEVVDEIERAYIDAELCLPWQKGSILLLDNFAMAHGRNPFQGERKILVAMTDAYDTSVSHDHELPAQAGM